MKCFLLRTHAGLAATDDAAREVLQGIKIGEYVRVDVRKERSAAHHRLFYAMCGKLAEARGVPTQVIVDTLKLRTGFYTPIIIEGLEYRAPASIAWDAMDQIQFSQFFTACCEEICRAWLPHMSPGKWRKDVLQMMGIEWDGDG